MNKTSPLVSLIQKSISYCLLVVFITGCSYKDSVTLIVFKGWRLCSVRPNECSLMEEDGTVRYHGPILFYDVNYPYIWGVSSKNKVVNFKLNDPDNVYFFINTNARGVHEYRDLSQLYAKLKEFNIKSREPLI